MERNWTLGAGDARLDITLHSSRLERTHLADDNLHGANGCSHVSKQSIVQGESFGHFPLPPPTLPPTRPISFSPLLSCFQKIPVWFKLDKDSSEKFPESFWKLIVYTITWGWISYIVFWGKEPYFFELRSQWESEFFVDMWRNEGRG